MNTLSKTCLQTIVIKLIALNTQQCCHQKLYSYYISAMFLIPIDYYRIQLEVSSHIFMTLPQPQKSNAGIQLVCSVLKQRTQIKHGQIIQRSKDSSAEAWSQQCFDIGPRHNETLWCPERTFQFAHFP